MYLSTTENIPGHRIVQVGGPIWGVGAYNVREKQGTTTLMYRAIEQAADSLCDSLKKSGFNGAIGLTQISGLANSVNGYAYDGYYVLMGTAVMVE